MTFSGLGLLPPLLRALDALGYRTPTPIQTQAIPAILAGRDLIAVAQTGTGKTAGFALPLLQMLDASPAAFRSPRALILVPTRELAEQVHQSLQNYGQNGSHESCALYGGVPVEPQVALLRAGVDIVVATPGRLLDLHRQDAIDLGEIALLVLDEADRMLDLGFARELDALFAALPRRRQTLLFSATLPDSVRAIARRILRNPLSIAPTPPNATAKGVRQEVITVDKKRKTQLFSHLLKRQRWPQVLVFVRTRKNVDELVGNLHAQGFAAAAIHGDIPQAARLQVLEQFKAGEVRVLVATDVAARGLDIDGLPVVVNFDLPTVAEDYIHRIGRTGRAGSRGEAISLVSADEVELLFAIERLLGKTLPREEEAGFEPTHQVPLGRPAGQPAQKPKNPRTPPKASGRNAGPGKVPGQHPGRGPQRPGSSSPASRRNKSR